MKNNGSKNEIIIYQGDGGMNVTMHIKNIFEEGELDEKSVCQDFLHTAGDGRTR